MVKNILFLMGLLSFTKTAVGKPYLNVTQFINNREVLSKPFVHFFEGERLTLVCKAVGFIDYVKWTKDGKEISNQGRFHVLNVTNMTILSISPIKSFDGGHYMCRNRKLLLNKSILVGVSRYLKMDTPVDYHLVDQKSEFDYGTVETYNKRNYENIRLGSDKHAHISEHIGIQDIEIIGCIFMGYIIIYCFIVIISIICKKYKTAKSENPTDINI